MAEYHSESLVLYPSPGMGHLVSMVKLARLLTHHGLHITILLVPAHYNTGATAPFLSAAASSNPSVSFHRLPPPPSLPPNPSPHHDVHAFNLMHHSNPSLLSFLGSAQPRPRALILDFFCVHALDVAAELRLPCYLFFTSCVSTLAAYFYLSPLHSLVSDSFKDLGSRPLHFPGVSPIPADHLPTPMQDRDDDGYRLGVYMSSRLPDFDGVLVNAMCFLEPRALKAIAEGECVEEGRRVPPVYCVGPLIKEGSPESRREACMVWLDGQPAGSVVFLCFGSLGLFSAEQLKEIAVGLERSGQRFLWVVRAPPRVEKGQLMAAPEEPDLDGLLPGFLQRTEGRGMVVKLWAPQVEVLRHEAVGGFVTHCGWNSVLEAVSGGVPMVGWPLYAEQRMNILFLVHDMKLAVEMPGYDKGFVHAAAIASRVRWLIESDQVKELRSRILLVRDAAVAALEEGGSSHSALVQLVSEWARPTAMPDVA